MGVNNMDKELIQNNINFLKEYIPKLIAGIEKEVDLLIKNDETLAFDLFQNIAEGLEWTIRSISSLENFGYINDLKLDEMNKVLHEVEESFQKKDFVLLADLLEYEVAEILVYWQEKLKKY
jgi:phosphopantothenoylcysteine synthetase/decarboxylase